MRYLILILLSVLQTCTSAVPVPLTFSDEQQFIDLSAYNFYLGRTAVYKYILTARPGKQVTLYLFTNNVNQYDIQVFDGDNDQAPQIDIRANIPKNDQIVEYPVPIQSSGQTMFIVLTADQRNTSAIVDFQAMATDYTQKGCGQLVTSINPKQEEELSMKLTASKQGGNCYYVFHANDPTNTLTLTQRVTTGFNENSTVYTLYKGLHTDSMHSLVNYGQWWDVKATDKYIIFNPIADIGIGYSWYYTNYLATTHVWLFTHDTLMTVDYLQDGYPNSQYPIQQDFL